MNKNELLIILEKRFLDNLERHRGITWKEILVLIHKDKILASLAEMEKSGGEPDVVFNKKTNGKIYFFDCSPESPSGRRSLCYDKKARLERKLNSPKSSAIEMAENMGVKLLTESDYKLLGQMGEFDLKTSSWVETPGGIRLLGGAIFCDKRYGQIFTYHNGADSYYASRGFRAKLEI